MNRIRQVFLSLKNMKYFYFIPLPVLFVLIPISNFTDISMLGLESSYITVMNTAQSIIPILSVWWVFCAIKEYIEGSGSEVLYVYRTKKNTNLINILLIAGWYFVHAGLLFITYSFLYDNIAAEFTRVIIQSLFFIGMYYFISYLFKSTSISFMFVLIYYMMTRFFSEDTIFEKITIFSLYQTCTFDLLINSYVIILFFGIVLFILGMIMEKNFFR